MKAAVAPFLVCFIFGFSAFGQQTICDGKPIDLNKGWVSSGPKAANNSPINNRAINFRKAKVPPQPIGRSGAITVFTLINKHGRVKSARAVGGPADLEIMSVKAVRRTKFRILLTNCQPTQYSGNFVINYPPK